MEGSLLKQAGELYNQQQYEQAAALYEQVLADAGLSAEEGSEACANLSECYTQCGKEKEALLAAFQSLASGILRPDKCYNTGRELMKKKNYSLAAIWFEQATKNTRDQDSSQVDISFSTWLPHVQLCVCYDRLGDHERAYRHHKLSQGYYPNHPSIQSNQNYFDSLIQRGVLAAPTDHRKKDRSKGNAEADGVAAILNNEQNHVYFTGERVVINDTVKKKHSDVLEEHLNRYRLAQKYVKGKRVLDAACGTGYGSKMLQVAGASYVLGVDIDQASLANAREAYEHESVDYVYGDVNKLALEDKSFDVVVSFETIEHIEDGRVWVQESARLLKDEGIFIVSTPNRTIANPAGHFVEQPRNRYHRYEYTTTEMIGELLKEYDLLGLYGQTFISDYLAFPTQVVRQARNMSAQFTPYPNPVIKGHELVALGDVKDMTPLYVVAVCRKKQDPAI